MSQGSHFQPLVPEPLGNHAPMAGRLICLEAHQRHPLLLCERFDGIEQVFLCPQLLRITPEEPGSLFLREVLPLVALDAQLGEVEVRDAYTLKDIHQLVLRVTVLHAERVLPHVDQLSDLVFHEEHEEPVDVPALVPDGDDPGLVPVIILQLPDLRKDGHPGVLPVHVIDKVLFPEAAELVHDRIDRILDIGVGLGERLPGKMHLILCLGEVSLLLKVAHVVI